MHGHLESDTYAELMVKQQIRSRGITDENVCAVMGKIPRTLFLKGIQNEKAYGDHPVSIGFGQTISQPYIVALMTQLLELHPADKVLEIGTGSGYQTAILAELARDVYSMERIPGLLKNAECILTGMGYTNIRFILDDGSGGWEEAAPYDKIIVTAAAPHVPERLKMQLADKGKMVIPIGDYKTYQVLLVVTRMGNTFQVKEDIGCRFVPLIGKYAFTL